MKINIEIEPKYELGQRVLVKYHNRWFSGTVTKIGARIALVEGDQRTFVSYMVNFDEPHYGQLWVWKNQLELEDIRPLQPVMNLTEMGVVAG